MTLRAPDGTGIKGGKTEGGKTAYHSMRMLSGLALLKEFPLDSEFLVVLIVYHARLAARAALNGMGRR